MCAHKEIDLLAKCTVTCQITAKLKNVAKQQNTSKSQENKFRDSTFIIYKETDVEKQRGAFIQASKKLTVPNMQVYKRFHQENA
jgi:hypothetical protein